MRRIIWAGSLGLMLGIAGTTARGGEVTWRPAASAPQAARSPAATLERPVPRSAATPQRDPAVTPVSLQTNGPAPTPTVIQAQGYDTFSSPPPPLAPPGAVPTVPGVVGSPVDPYGCGVVSDAPVCSPWGFGPCLERGWFRSDHCFDQFISPVTNPFLFEDPRSLTEVRPIFMYQAAPSNNPNFNGGNLGFFGMQARLAITDRWSFVLNKLGFVWIDPNNPSGEFSSETGFAEVWLGPKYTFLRSETTGTLGAVGLTFQIPTGPQRVFQNTGSLSLTPYLSLGQNYWRTSYGSFNALGTIGYSFATEDHRSDYFFLSAHLDYDIANLHRIYPLIELNWFHYTANGDVRSLSYEGRDLINFGSNNVTGNDTVSLAAGLRYKFSEAIQTGIAAEWSASGRKDLLDFRLTADLIFRY